MSYNELLKILAPCGLNCGKCQAFAEGDIKRHAQELKRLLGSFDGYAERFSNFLPVFRNYPEFKEMLNLFSDKLQGMQTGGLQVPELRSRCLL